MILATSHSQQKYYNLELNVKEKQKKMLFQKNEQKKVVGKANEKEEKNEYVRILLESINFYNSTYDIRY